MKPFSSWPIRVYLLVIVMLIVVPCTIIMLLGTRDIREQQMRHSRNDALQMARSAAFQQERVVEGAHQLLVTLSRLDDVAEFRAERASSLFALLMQYNPFYQNIILADATGLVRASGAPVHTQVIAHRKFFSDVMSAKGFTIGEFVMSEFAKLPVIHYAYPVFDARNRLAGVVAIAFSLEHYGRLFAEMRLPENSALSVTDWNGTRLYRFPDPERYEGQADVPEIREKMLHGESEGVFTATGVDGVERLYGFSRLSRDGTPYMFIRVGISREVVLARVKGSLIRNGVLMVLVLIFSLGVARVIGERLIIARMNRLVNEARELMRGNLKARTGLDHDESEFGTLARAFDEMAVALERRAMENALANAGMAASLKEKEVLLKEVHHRVKNNLQIISSLLSLQSRRVLEPGTLDLFRESQNRVRSIALVHEKLYQSSSFTEINFHEYVDSLVSGLSHSFGGGNGRISFSLDIPGTRVSLTRAIPCGLIINELISNAMKHAFPEDRGGDIFIGFSGDGNRYRLVVRDDGAGFPAGVDWKNTITLGMELVNNLVNQLDGEIEMRQNCGTEFIITFPGD